MIYSLAMILLRILPFRRWKKTGQHIVSYLSSLKMHHCRRLAGRSLDSFFAVPKGEDGPRLANVLTVSVRPHVPCPYRVKKKITRMMTNSLICHGTCVDQPAADSMGNH